MLGKHVNVSVKNKKFMHKVLCLILAIVLVGLMVPHGLAAQLNAYAQNETETPAVDTPADNPETIDPTPEEVNTPEAPVPAAPVADNGETEITFSVELAFPSGVYLDDTDSAGSDSLPEFWDVEEQTGVQITKIKRQQTIPAGTEEPTRLSVIDELNKYRSPSGASSNLIKGLSEGCALEDFIYTLDPQGTMLNNKVVSDNYKFTAVINTSITVNPGTKDGEEPSNPKLWYLAQGGSYAPYEGWPTTSTSVLHLQLGSTWSIANNVLTVTGSSLIGDHKLYENFTGKLECDNFDFNGFASPGGATTGTIAYNTTFTGTWKDAETTVKLQDPGSVVTADNFFKSVGGADFVPATWADFTVLRDTTSYNVVDITDSAYSGGLKIGNTVYAFKLGSGSVGLGQYSFDKWEVSTNGSQYSEVGGDPATITTSLIYFRATFKENHKLTHSFNFALEDAKLMTHKKDADPWVAAPDTIYYSDNYYYSLSSDNILKVEHKGADGSYVVVDYYKVDIPSTATGYKFGKWTVGTDDVTTEREQILADVALKSNIQVALTFKVAPEETSSVAHIVDIVDDKTVTVVYAYPGDDITVAPGDKLNQITVGSSTYKTVIENTDYEFVSWTLNPSTVTTSVPQAPFTATANFGKSPIVKLHVDLDMTDLAGNITDYVWVDGGSGKLAQDYAITGLNIGSTIKLGQQNNIVETSNGQKFQANTTNPVHFADFDDVIWYIKGETAAQDTPLTTAAVELKDADDITLVAKAKRIDNLNVSGTVTDGTSALKDANIYADVSLKNADGTYKYLETKSVSTDNTGAYTVEKLPNNSFVKLYATCENYNVANINGFDVTADVTGKDFVLISAYSFEPATTPSTTWLDSRGVKTFTLSATPTLTEGAYSFTSGSTMKIPVVKGDKISFASFTGEPTEYALEFSYQNSQTQIPNIQWTRTYTYEATQNGVLTVTWGGAGTLNFVSIEAANRIVKFANSGIEGTGGTFNDGTSDITELAVPGLGTTVEKKTSAKDEDEIVFKVNGEVFKTITASADEKSIFRSWDLNDVTGIIENTTIYAKFVKANISVKIEKQVDTTAVTYKTAKSVTPSAEFTVPNGTTAQSTYGKITSLMKFTVPTGKPSVTDLTVVANSTDKFVLNNPFDFDESKVIDETYEETGLTIHYQIIERAKIDVHFATNGATSINQEPSDVPAVEGGGAWTKSSETPVAATYSNKFFEDTNYTAILAHWANVKLDKPSGFFTGWDNQEGTLTEETTWTAQYDDAAHVTVNVKESKPDSPQALKDMVVVLESQDTYIAPGTKTVTGIATATTGSYDLKVYGYSKYQKYITGDLTAGGQGYIEQSGELVEGDWNASASATKEFALDKGYSFFPSDYQDKSYTMYARYYDRAGTSPHIAFGGTVSVDEDNVTLSGNATLTFEIGNNFRLDSGDELIMTTSTVFGHFNIETAQYIKEDVPIKDAEFLYTCFASEVKLNVKSTVNEEAKKISRIDYRMPWEDYISVYGTVTEQGTDNPLSGIKVSYNANNSNEVVHEKYTNDEGMYYIVLKTLKGDETGTVMFEDVDGGTDDHLDERVRLSSKDTSDIRPTSPAASGDWSKPAMIPAIHVTGMITQPKPGEEETEAIPVEGAAISFQQDSSDPYTWNNYIHSPAYTDADGTYSLKLKKDENTSGGKVWFSKEGYTDDGHFLMIWVGPGDDDYENLPHGPNDLANISGMLTLEGASVSILGGEGHKLFEVKYYNAGRCYLTKEMESVDELNFAQNGVFQSVYGESGSLLRYEFKAAGIDDFAITLRPVAGDGYTYWAWRCFDKTDNKKWTLKDQEKIGEGGKLANHEYEFTVDYAEGTEVTVGGNSSVGHAGWNFDLSVTSGGVAGDSIHNVIGTGDYSFMIPITQNQEPEYANETTEEINVGYSFKDGAFNLELNTEFQPESGDPVPYTERRAFTPIPAEGYMFTGIAVNGQDLAPGAQETIDLSTGSLNVVAKYAEIPNPASTGDSTPNMMWLVGLAILAMLGIAFGASRKQKGIRC